MGPRPHSSVTIAIIVSLCLVAAVSCRCSYQIFGQMSDVRRDAFLLTEGEGLRLSCGVCGICLPASHSGCSNPTSQLWMSVSEMEKAQIRSRTKLKYTYDPMEGKYKSKRQRFRAFLRRTKERLVRFKQRVKKVFLTAKRHMANAVQRFDRLKRLFVDSDNGAGSLREVWSPKENEAHLQWFVERANGKVSKIKHESAGRILLYDLLIIGRSSVGNTGVYTCRWQGITMARYVVTVVEGGVEPYREFEPSVGRSLQPKLLSKANLEVYTRWMNQTRSVLVKVRNSTMVKGTVLAHNISITWGVCYVKQLDADRPVIPEGSPMLKLIPHGLPCRSHLLPMSIRSLRTIIKRPSEAKIVRVRMRVTAVQFGFGLMPAEFISTSPPPVSVEASLIKRSFMIAKQGGFVSLFCPLSRTVRTLIVWFKLPNDTERLLIRTQDIVDGTMDPFSMRDDSRGRIFTDPGGNLNIANVTKATDHRKFFCLHKGRIIGYIKLIVRNTEEDSKAMNSLELIMNTMLVASPLIVTASILFLTLIAASSLHEPHVPW